jgi:hypothetical protein
MGFVNICKQGIMKEWKCFQVSRFLNQIVTDTVALSGMNLFFITRTMLLTVSFLNVKIVI